jgi:hypothetical protein
MVVMQPVVGAGVALAERMKVVLPQSASFNT